MVSDGVVLSYHSRAAVLDEVRKQSCVMLL